MKLPREKAALLSTASSQFYHIFRNKNIKMLVAEMSTFSSL